MHFPAYLLIPAAAAVIYTVSSLLFKRAYAEGAGTLTAFHWANFIGMPVAAPLFFINAGSLPPAEWWRPALVAGTIYLGSLGTFSAIRRGDVSMVTPILGTKVLFVAALAFVFSNQELSTGLWGAAVLATAGIFVIGRADLKPGSANGPAILLCLGSSLLFAITDLLIGKWAHLFGGTAFLAAIPQFIGLYSLVAGFCTKAPVLRLDPQCRPWIVWGGILLAMQLMALGLVLAFFNDPTGVNILYSTRGLWSIVFVWAFGSWFANHERQRAGRRTMLWRLAGTILITAGVVIAVLERAQIPM